MSLQSHSPLKRGGRWRSQIHQSRPKSQTISRCGVRRWQVAQRFTGTAGAAGRSILRCNLNRARNHARYRPDITKPLTLPGQGVSKAPEMRLRTLWCAKGHDWVWEGPLESPPEAARCPSCGEPGSERPEPQGVDEGSEQEYEGYGPH